MIICGILCGSFRHGRNVLGRLLLRVFRIGQSRIRHVANIVLFELLGTNNHKLSAVIQRLTAVNRTDSQQRNAARTGRCVGEHEPGAKHCGEESNASLDHKCTGTS